MENKNNVTNLLEVSDLDWKKKEMMLLDSAFNNFKELLNSFINEDNSIKIELINTAFNDIKDIYNHL